MLEMVGLVLILTVLIYAISRGMISDLARPYLTQIMSHPAQFPSSAELPSPPQSDAVDRPDPDPVGTGSDWLDGETIRLTKRELVHLLARIVLTDDDDRLLSQDIISRAAGIGKERAAEMIRAARGQPDPAQPAKRQIPHRVNGEERLMEVDW